MIIQPNSDVNVTNAINNQNAYYQRVTNLVGRKVEYPTINLLLAESLSISNNATRGTLFEIPGPWGSTPSFNGTAGSPTIGVIERPPKIG